MGSDRIVVMAAGRVAKSSPEKLQGKGKGLFAGMLASAREAFEYDSW